MWFVLLVDILREARFADSANGGTIVAGCVDAIHTGHLSSPSNSADWHTNGEVIRKAELARLKS